jgi:hypothetical protein
LHNREALVEQKYIGQELLEWLEEGVGLETTDCVILERHEAKCLCENSTSTDTNQANPINYAEIEPQSEVVTRKQTYWQENDKQ